MADCYYRTIDMKLHRFSPTVALGFSVLVWKLQHILCLSVMRPNDIDFFIDFWPHIRSASYL